MNTRLLSIHFLLITLVLPGLSATEVLPLISENFNDVETGQAPPNAILTVPSGSEVRVVDKDSTPAHPFEEVENKSLYVKQAPPVPPVHTHVRFDGAQPNYGLVRGTATLVFYADAANTRSFFRIADSVVTKNAAGNWISNAGTDAWAAQLQFNNGVLHVSSGQVGGRAAAQTWVPNEANVVVVHFDVETQKYSLTLNGEEVSVTFQGVTNTEFDFVGQQVKTISYANLQLSPSSGNIFYESLHIEGEWIELTGIDAWRAEHFDSFRNRLNNADPDGDGVFNLVEYALGGNPTLADRSILPTVEVDGNDLVMNLTRPIGLEGISYDFEFSSDLETWVSGEEYITIDTPVDNGDGTELVRARATAALADGGRGFLRFSVEEVEE